MDVVNKNSKDATVIVKDENVLDINGWAFDDKTRSVPGTVFIELAPVKGGEKYYAAANRGERPDLVNTFSEPAYKKAGYSLEADIKSVLPGQYNINIIQIGDGYAIKASTGKRIDKKGLFFLR